MIKTNSQKSSQKDAKSQMIIDLVPQNSDVTTSKNIQKA